MVSARVVIEGSCASIEAIERVLLEWIESRRWNKPGQLGCSLRGILYDENGSSRVIMLDG